jgi:ferritin
MLSKALVEKLNEQINLEFYSSNLYLQMSAWCECQGLQGCATFLSDHAAEEMRHMQRLWQYVNEKGTMSVVGAIEAPPTEFDSLASVFQDAFEHECTITRKINELAQMAFSEPDFTTFNFLQWFITEQHEEETLFQGILDKMKLIGTEANGMFMIDREIGALAGGGGEASPADEAGI